jgi:hypothetical protein
MKSRALEMIVFSLLMCIYVPVWLTQNAITNVLFGPPFYLRMALQRRLVSKASVLNKKGGILIVDQWPALTATFSRAWYVAPNEASESYASLMTQSDVDVIVDAISVFDVYPPNEYPQQYLCPDFLNWILTDVISPADGMGLLVFTISGHQFAKKCEKLNKPFTIIEIPSWLCECRLILNKSTERSPIG